MPSHVGPASVRTLFDPDDQSTIESAPRPTAPMNAPRETASSVRTFDFSSSQLDFVRQAASPSFCALPAARNVPMPTPTRTMAPAVVAIGSASERLRGGSGGGSTTLSFPRGGGLEDPGGGGG